VPSDAGAVGVRVYRKCSVTFSQKGGTMSTVSRIAVSLCLVVLGFCCSGLPAAGATESAASSGKPEEVPLPDAVIKRLPADWQETARKYVTVRKTLGGESEVMSWYTKMQDDEVRTSILDSLSFQDGPEEFVIDHLPEALPNRDLLILVANLYHQRHWWSHTRIDPVLEKMAVSIPDQEIAMACLEAVRKLEMQRLRQVLEQRIDQPQAGRTPEITAQLEQEDERWISLVSGTMLPAFLRRVPPVFEVKPGAESIRVLAFGDFGFCKELGIKDQEQTAAAMRAYHHDHPFDFGITLGDNFYAEGMQSPDDSRWQPCWEALYGPMKLKFYAVFGNHDWYGLDSPAAEILYTERSKTWRMPAPYYTYTAGPVQFFAIDTMAVSRAQSKWLTQALEQSHAHWKVVYGHFPPYIASPFATSDPEVVATLMPILKGRADVYFSGHHHSLEHLKPVDGVNLFIAGGGGATTYDVDPQSPVALFAKQEYGFAVLEAGPHTFTVRFIDKNSHQLDETILRK